MTNIKEQLRLADEDYLIGLSNKGTVKRAGKDLENETPTVVWTETEAQVALKEETCVIRSPLGDSSCSCPSRSICRHIVTAILWLKRETGADADAGSDAGGDEAKSRGTAGSEVKSGGAKSCEAAGSDAGGDEAKSRGTAGSDAGAGGAKSHEVEVSEVNSSLAKEAGPIPVSGAGPEPFPEMLQVPPARLQRACGSQRFRRFLAHLRAGETAAVKETSIVTVTLPWEGAVVKLLVPLEHSSCSCHSRELCPHKAQALLAYQLKKGQISLAELEGFLESEVSFDLEAVRTAAAAVRESVVGQFANGLARQSREVEESLERLAVLCHRAGLAQMENRLREAATEYRQYFERSAAFRVGELAKRLLFLYDRVDRLEKAGSQETVRRLAGNFRDRYEPVGRLRLMGIGVRFFVGKSGYEGETWYFFEMKKRKWYTWTDARPTFYEGVKKRPAATENAPAPWNLGCSRQQLSELEFELSGAKAASGGRLSASQETRGETVGQRDLQAAAFLEIVAWDYEKLLRELFGPGSMHGRGERLVLAGAVRWNEPAFDRVSQRFSWQLFDEKDRELLISVKYTKQERLTIQLLERLEKRLWNRGCETLICFGALYLENGRMCLYPIELFPQAARPAANEAPKPSETPGPEKTVRLSANGTPKPSETPGPKAGNAAAVPAADKISRKQADLSAVQALSRYVDETFGLLTDLFTGGLLSGSDERGTALRQLCEVGERLGLHQAAEELRQIEGYLQQKRHCMEFSPEPMVEAIARLWRYLTACREKLSYDKTVLVMDLTDGNV